MTPINADNRGKHKQQARSCATSSSMGSTTSEKLGDEQTSSTTLSSTSTSRYRYIDYAPSSELFTSTLSGENPLTHSSSLLLSSSLNTGSGVPRSTPIDVRSQILPVKLNAMLSNPSFSHIITWLPHGRAWIVVNPGEFKKQVAPIYFEQPNYSSFIRLVNAWGFRRLSSGLDERAYYHELFLRGMPHLHQKMRRLTRSQKKVQIDPKDLPDFYNMEPLPEPSVPSYLPPSRVQNFTPLNNNNSGYLTSHYNNGQEQPRYVTIPVGSIMPLESHILARGGLIANSPIATSASAELPKQSSIRTLQSRYNEPSCRSQYQVLRSASNARIENEGFLFNPIQADLASFLQAQNQNEDPLFIIHQNAVNQIIPSADAGVAMARAPIGYSTLNDQPTLLASSFQQKRDSTYLSQVLTSVDTNPVFMQCNQAFPLTPQEHTYRILAMQQQQMEEQQHLL